MDKPHDKDTEVELKSIVNHCMDSPGYLLFGAYLSPKRNEQGEAIIDFQYRRYHFALEDAKQAILQLKKFVDEEIERLIQTDLGPEQI